MKPQIIRRIGNRFDVDKTKILPYLRKHQDAILKAVDIICQDFKNNKTTYSQLSNQEKLDKLNDRVYQILTEWGIYKNKEK